MHFCVILDCLAKFSYVLLLLLKKYFTSAPFIRFVVAVAFT
jgi:hypothetical protein